MQTTHKYHFPTSGTLDGCPELAQKLAKQLTEGPNSLGDYFLFPPKDKIIDNIDFELTEDEQTITGMNLYTYIEHYVGMEEYLQKCIQENLDMLTEKRISLNGPAELITEEDACDFTRAITEMEQHLSFHRNEQIL